MSRQSASAANPAWLGTPPVVSDGFSFANGEFFAEASGHKLHRRASPGDLKDHFSRGSDKDHPAHWFEAQLLHYGLKPSKTKSVARMRLFDAFNAGELTVPSHISKLEGRLKKDWAKNDREAKKTTGAAARTTAGTSTKRKAEVNAGGASGSTSSVQRDTKKAKTTEAKSTTTTASATVKRSPATKASSAQPKQASRARRGNISQGQARSTSTTLSSSASTSRQTKPTARRGQTSQSPSRGASAAGFSPAPSLHIDRRARRSAPFMRGRIPTPQVSSPHYGDYDDYDSNSESGSYDNDDDEPPPPYRYLDEDGDRYGVVHDLAPLGLINGSYNVTSSVTKEWPHYGSGFKLTLTLAGSKLWARFDLGVVEGVMRFPNRPQQSSHEPIPFKWRGQEDQGPVIYGNANDGWIKFLGNGRIQGRLDFMGITFQGERRQGQGTRSEIAARRLQDQWNSYSEEEYERQNQARWG